MDAETTGHGSTGMDTAQAHGGSSVVQIRLGLEASTIAIVLSLMLVIAACGVAMGLNLSRQAQIEERLVENRKVTEDKERQVELLKYYLLELDAKFIGAGLKKPEESIAKKLEKHQ